ncbi:MAG: amino acid permease [Phycisphaerae bacterium]|nr:amino acid permease [Phycisphaerae bacterium]
MPPIPPDVDVAQLPDASQRHRTNVLVVSSVALAFISFWRAAAIVLCDLASTSFYIGGISEEAIGKAAPWFILAVMLFVYPVTAVYMESCTMFTRGGVYKVVKGAIGGGLAKLSVSALMFDYILTGPISSVSAGKYLVGLFGDLLHLATRYGHHPLIFDSVTHPDLVNILSVLIALGITGYFWRLNIIGIHESSDRALRIMQLTTVMGVIVIGWSLLTLAHRPQEIAIPPLHPVFTQTSLDPEKESSAGWLEHVPAVLGALGILAAFGHSLLAMSGEESLAQVNREIEAPKLKNLIRTGIVLCIYTLLLTGSISFLAVLIIPDGRRVVTQVVNNGVDTRNATEGQGWWEVDYLRKHDSTHSQDWGYFISRHLDDHGQVILDNTRREITIDRRWQHVERDDGGYRDNLINGLVNFLWGPAWLRIIVEIFVVLVGFLILAGAVNTSIIGSNGVLNRLAEDGVLTRWFQHPQAKFGTTHRLINLVGIMQVMVIIASLGNVNTLGEAYAFGVIWSFVFMTMSMAVLRFKDLSPRQFETPINISIPRGEGQVLRVPIGIFAVFLILISTALINLATKKTATLWGIGFTGIFLTAFIIMEYVTRRMTGGVQEHVEQFNEQSSDALTAEAAGITLPDPIVVAARGPNSLPVLSKVLHEVDTTQRDVVVLTCKVLPRLTPGITPMETEMSQDDRELLTKVVTVAEDIGRRVHPVVLPTNNPLYAIARAARDLKATEVVLGVSQKIHAEEQLEQFALAWGSAIAEMSGEGPPLRVRIMGPQVEIKVDM